MFINSKIYVTQKGDGEGELRQPAGAGAGLRLPGFFVPTLS